jgi:hypothetical protein
MPHKLVNGIKVELTAEEIAARAAEEAAWNAGAFDRAMSSLRQKRDALLKSTDYLALSDNTLSAEMKSYRQALRDITNGLTTENMFDNWLKSWEDLYTYKYWKKQIIQWNEKTIQFWKDAYEDLTSKKDKD